MIAKIMNNLPPFEKINASFYALLLLSLSMMVLVYVVVHCNMDNDSYTIPVGFKDTNESRNNSDDDNGVDSTEVSFSKSHCKDAEHAHE